MNEPGRVRVGDAEIGEEQRALVTVVAEISRQPVREGVVEAKIERQMVPICARDLSVSTEKQTGDVLSSFHKRGPA